MINEIIYKGLHIISHNCRYFKVEEGETNTVVDDIPSSTIFLKYVPGTSIKSFSEITGIGYVGDGLSNMESTGNNTIKIMNVGFSINGMRFKKLTYDPHILNIIISDDTESRVVQTYDYTTIVVSNKDYNNPEFIDFLFYGDKFKYIKRVGPKISGYEISNFPKIIIGSESLNLNSSNKTFYTLRKRYNDYLIRSIDYLDQFIVEMRRIFDSYGVEFIRINKESTLSRTSYVTYQIHQTPIRTSHVKTRTFSSKIIGYKIPIDFSLHTSDMVLFHDFKTKYLNVDLLTNFTEFKTSDRYGQRWTAAIKWNSITEDFNHVYQPDDNSNFSYQCQFRAEIFFYEVIDESHEYLNEVIHNLKIHK